MRNIVTCLLLILSWILASSALGAPCSYVDHSLNKKTKLALAPAIATQLDVEKVDVLQSYRLGGWSIIYVDAHKGDEVFLFYAKNPLTDKYITMWSGAATRDEEKAIKDWTLKNAPGIPNQLASCFAWQVTVARNVKTESPQH
jgi:hypothetical protein